MRFASATACWSAWIERGVLATERNRPMFRNQTKSESRRFEPRPAAAVSLVVFFLAFSLSPAPIPAHAAESLANHTGTIAFRGAHSPFQASAARAEVRS